MIKNFVLLIFLLICAFHVSGSSFVVDSSLSISSIQDILSSNKYKKLIFKEGIYLFKGNDRLFLSGGDINIVTSGTVVFKFTDGRNPNSLFFEIDSNSKNIRISGFTFDGNLKSGRFGIRVGENVKNIKIKNNKFINFRNLNGLCYALCIPARNVKNLYIAENLFYNISSLGDGIVGTQYGMSGAIYFYKYSDYSKSDFPTKSVIKKNHFDSIYLYSKKKDHFDFDSDAIRIYIPNDSESFNLTKRRNIIIYKNVFNNVQKSAIKSQSFPGLLISNNKIFSSLPESMFVAVRIYGNKSNSYNTKIKSLFISGNIQRAILLNGNDFKVKSISLNTIKGNFPLIQIGSQDISSNIIIKNIFGNDFSSILFIDNSAKTITLKLNKSNSKNIIINSSFKGSVKTNKFKNVYYINHHGF